MWSEAAIWPVLSVVQKYPRRSVWVSYLYIKKVLWPLPHWHSPSPRCHVIRLLDCLLCILYREEVINVSVSPYWRSSFPTPTDTEERRKRHHSVFTVPLYKWCPAGVLGSTNPSKFSRIMTENSAFQVRIVVIKFQPSKQADEFQLQWALLWTRTCC